MIPLRRVGAAVDPAAPGPTGTGDGTDSDEAIRQPQARVMEVFEKRPAAGQSTPAVSAHIEDGLRCAVAEGDHTVVADMPEVMGGDAAGPSPGFYARAGLASCIAIRIKMTAVREGHVLARVEVRVETDFDDAALFGLALCRYFVKVPTAVDMTTDEIIHGIGPVVEDYLWRA